MIDDQNGSNKQFLFRDLTYLISDKRFIFYMFKKKHNFSNKFRIFERLSKKNVSIVLTRNVYREKQRKVERKKQ